MFPPKPLSPIFVAFGCTTPDLLALADWLAFCGVTSVAMESTGVEWIPLFQILSQRKFQVFLVNATRVKTVPEKVMCLIVNGYNNYTVMAYWHPLLSGEGEVAVLRSYLRQRENLIQNSTSHVQRMPHALTQMNLQLHKVISDITGVSGLNIRESNYQWGKKSPERAQN